MPRSFRSTAAALLLPALGAACAGPADSPLRLTPDRDVAVTYRLSGAEGALMHRSWLVAGQRLRVEFGPVPGLGGYTILDGRGGRAFMVSDMARTVTIFPLPPGAGIQDPALRADARYQREGQERIAAAACTVWRVEGPAGAPTRACITSDGVLLRSETQIEGHRISREAIRLQYAPQDPARFRPPAGYATLDLSEGEATPNRR